MNGRVSDPVLTSGFLLDLAHSGVGEMGMGGRGNRRKVSGNEVGVGGREC